MQIEDLITFGFLADIDEESRSLTHGCRKDWERSEKLRGFKRWRNRIDSIRRTQGFFVVVETKMKMPKLLKEVNIGCDPLLELRLL